MLAGDSRVDVIGEAARLTDFEEMEADLVILSASSLNPSTSLSTSSEWPLPDSLSLLLLTDSPLSPTDALRTRPSFGILPADVSSEEILAAVHALAEGLTVGPRSLLFPNDSASPSEPGPLTERELEVLNLIAEGLANKQIAVQLGISEHTVKFHISSIYSKLNATNRAEAIRAGLRGGWIAL